MKSVRTRQIQCLCHTFLNFHLFQCLRHTHNITSTWPNQQHHHFKLVFARLFAEIFHFLFCSQLPPLYSYSFVFCVFHSFLCRIYLLWTSVSWTSTTLYSLWISVQYDAMRCKCLCSDWNTICFEKCAIDKEDGQKYRSYV